MEDGATQLRELRADGQTMDCGPVFEHPEVDVEYVQQRYLSPAVFRGDGLTFVYSALGTGKTTALRAFVEIEAPDATLLVLTPRCTLADFYKEKFPRAVNYRDMPGARFDLRELGGGLILEVESLWRLDHYDAVPNLIVVLDEVMETVLSFADDATHDFRYCEHARRLTALVRCARRVVCMDANLDAAAVRFFEEIRGGRARLVHNLCRPGALAMAGGEEDVGARLFVYGQRKRWWDDVVGRLRAGCNVWIATSVQASEAEEMGRMLAEAGFRGVVLTGATADRRSAMARLADTLSGARFFITTPVLTSGVSYDEAGFDVVAGLFPAGVVAAETAMQQLLRCRQVARREYLVCLLGCARGDPVRYPCTREELVRGVQAGQRMLDVPKMFRDPRGRGLQSDYDSDAFEMWLLAQRIRNASMRAFRPRLLGLAQEYGLECVRIVGDSDDGARAEDRLDLKSPAKLREEDCRRIARARLPLTCMQLRALRSGEANEETLAAEKKAALCRLYGLDLAAAARIDGAFVRDFSHEHVAHVYMRLRALLRGGRTIRECLEEVRVEDAARLAGPDSFLRTAHYAPMSKAARMLAHLLGRPIETAAFAQLQLDVSDFSRRSAEATAWTLAPAARLRTVLEAPERNAQLDAADVVAEPQTAPPVGASFKAVLGWVNATLRDLLGLQLRAGNRHCNAYFLEIAQPWTRCFARDHALAFH